MPSMNNSTSRKKYWRSLEERADSPEFRKWVEQEFPAAMPELISASSRRTFLQLMGASMALAGLTACRWPKETILPFSQRPEGRVPGESVSYATVMDVAGAVTGLLVTSYDGRPVKVEGNPDHPASRGATDPLAQAAVLELYDPDRARRLVRRDGHQETYPDWAEFDTFIREHLAGLRADGGMGLRVLSGNSSSPSLLRSRAQFQALFPRSRWVEYEALSRDNEREGARIAFGRFLRIRHLVDQAEIIACFDADLLADHPASLVHAKGFAAGRRRVDGGKMNRLYAVESCYSLTGAMADERCAVAGTRIESVLRRVAAELAARGMMARVEGLDESRNLPAKAEAVAVRIAADLAAHRGAALVAVGPRQPAPAHALGHLINEALGAFGRTVEVTEDPDGDRPSHVEAISSLAKEMQAGQVRSLLILGGNPVFDAPADLAFEELLAQVPTTIRLGLYEDETAAACHWNLPMAHFLEAWGDARSWDGTYSVAQPLIAPLHEGRSPIELLARLTGMPLTSGYDIVRETFRQMRAADDFEKAWRRTVHDGMLAESAFPAPNVKVVSGAVGEALGRSVLPPAGEGLELSFVRGGAHDGRFANNGWLQELPDPLTKLCWDNALLVAPSTAEAMGLAHGDLVTLASGGRQLEAPVFIAPGQAPDSAALAVGYGRRKAGRVGDGVGADAYRLRVTGAMHHLPGVKVTRTGSTYPLSCTQDHFAIDQLGREEAARRLPELVREADLHEYQEHPDFVEHRTHQLEEVALWKEFEYEGHKWGMAIDLNTCIGCSACVIACQAENNTPVVGKERVGEGREMHWLRVDRYYKGEPDEAQIAFQPVACHHCENAPCESVCPVAATVHDAEGLNTMVYNRCVGTRYCSNNCPYKVRHFNFFNYHKDLTELQALVHNPEVTVRSRGVMEKCTYCVQRINAVKIDAKNAKRTISDGEITPACAQVCPTEAIVFGDLNDPESRVAKAQRHRRSYAMLAELNVKPRTEYLAKIRNPAASPGKHGAEEHD